MDERLDPVTVATRTYFGALYRATPRPLVTWALIASNVGVALAMAVRNVDIQNPSVEDLIRWGGQVPAIVRQGAWWRMETATFLHGGFVHLLVNMYCLKVLGPLVERLLGSLGFLVAYLVAGLAGSVAVQAFADPFVVTIGASGCIFGLYGAILAYVLRLRGVLPKPARKELTRVTLINVAINLAATFALPQISKAAHLGGLVGGFLCTLALAAPPTEKGLARRRRRALTTAFAAALLLAWAILWLSRQPLPK